MSELVSENFKGAQKHQKLWYDQNARERVLEPEDEVLVLLPTTSNRSYWLNGKGPIVYCVE